MGLSLLVKHNFHMHTLIILNLIDVIMAKISIIDFSNGLIPTVYQAISYTNVEIYILRIGPKFDIKTICRVTGIPTIKIWQLWYSLIFIMGITIVLRPFLYITTTPHIAAMNLTWYQVVVSACLLNYVLLYQKLPNNVLCNSRKKTLQFFKTVQHGKTSWR